MKKIYVFILLVLLLAFAFAYGGTAFAGFPVIPKPTILPLNFSVNIPDAHLNAALHYLTGVPSAEKLSIFDLAALTGSVNLENLSIADAEGIQYCTNITFLTMAKNPLTNLPAMTAMTKLETLRLWDCGLSEWPSGKLPPNLKTLDLSYNDIHELPDPLTDSSAAWRHLDLSGNDLKEVPAWVWNLSNLQSLYLSDNELTKLPDDVKKLTSLKLLSISGNKLEALPDSICSMTNLYNLSVSGNGLYNLPADIGNHVGFLDASNNRLESIPSSVGSSSSVYAVDFRINRITKLPSNFDDHEYDFVNVEFNFIDMSAGSADKTIINSTDSMEKYYIRQLKPVTGLTAVPSSDSITLSWQPGEDGSEGGAEWEVTGYVVYLYDGEMIKLADVETDILLYTHTGLQLEKEYQYRVGVDYVVSDPAYGDDVEIRCYTRLSASTVAESLSSSDTPEETPTAAETTAAATEQPSEDTSVFPDSTDAGGSDGLPVWAIIVIAVLGTGLLGTGAAIGIIKFKGSKKTAKHDSGVF